MDKLSFSQQVALPADRVWATIGDFGGLSKWATRVASERIEDRQDGRYRIITHQTGAVYQERLVSSGELFYTYAVNRTGTDFYEATIAVKAISTEQSEILLSVQFQPKADGDTDALSHDIAAFFQGTLRAMTKALALESG